jgi:uncharacterized membrane protein YccF (DUF307 family)
MDVIQNTLAKFLQEVKSPRGGWYLVLGGILITIFGCAGIGIGNAIAQNPAQGSAGSVIAALFLLAALLMVLAGVVIAIIGGVMALIQNQKERAQIAKSNPPVIHNVVNSSIAEEMKSQSTHLAPSQPTVFIQRSSGPGCIVQSIWFIFIGWWLGALLISLAWLLNITIIGLPLGMAILNGIPKVLALQSSEKKIQAVSRQGTTIISESELPQHNFLLRTVYFVLIGWWWSGIWLSIAYILCATIILLPVGLEMFRLTPAMTTLRKY